MICPFVLVAVIVAGVSVDWQAITSAFPCPTVDDPCQSSALGHGVSLPVSFLPRLSSLSVIDLVGGSVGKEVINVKLKLIVVIIYRNSVQVKMPSHSRSCSQICDISELPLAMFENLLLNQHGFTYSQHVQVGQEKKERMRGWTRKKSEMGCDWIRIE